MTRGRALELFFVDGDPEGMATAEVVNWTGHVLRVPRNAIKTAFKRPEADRTGCYLLRSRSMEQATLYVGEGENIGSRIASHDLKKEWWDEAYFITTTSDALHKAHVKYLEARLVQLARAAGKVNLDNGNTPTQSRLSEAASSAMEEYLELLFIALGALGVSDFLTGVRKTTTPSAGETTLDDSRPAFFLNTPKHGIVAKAFLDSSDFVVAAGSKARSYWASKAESQHTYSNLFRRLVDTGIMVHDQNNCIFTSDYAFDSPSAAAAVVNGRPTNGRTDWKTKEGLSYGDWEAQAVNEL